ncbi:hypothetical protein [Rhodococcus marinonascens]|uniref:hypothetical protein n=1 Tax=Rhodococcus marinonascens TaxID=38311 RepID=UPI000934AC7F|nr:hypothetical protein [Rhodococcus marinonascens]
MGQNRNYDLSTIELGHYGRLADLHRDLTNHAETAITLAHETEGQTVVSISHSIVSIDGKLYASILLTLETP